MMLQAMLLGIDIGLLICTIWFYLE